MGELLDNLELQWPLWGSFVLDKPTGRGTLKTEDPKPLTDDGIHYLIGIQKLLKDKMT